MLTARRMLPALPGLVFAMLVADPSLAEDKPTVTLKSVKFAEMDKAIQGFKGKVVVVDLWSTT